LPAGPELAGDFGLVGPGREPLASLRTASGERAIMMKRVPMAACMPESEINPTKGNALDG
jgi:hypothetical protein